MEDFLSSIMDENAITGDLMDDEYYLFVGEGTSRRILLIVSFCYDL